MWSELITVAETPTFIRQADAAWSEQERWAFIDFIARNPEAGDIIPETGGVRKVRWRMQGRGKRSGTRVIYFFYNRETPIYLLMVYAKGLSENISSEAKKLIREFAARIKNAHRRHETRRGQ
jgi:mRNA-degrading endonuclease RelE of RelBE toxin-antitoxin system